MFLSVATLNSRYYQVELELEEPKIEYFFQVSYNNSIIYLGENISNLGTTKKENLKSFEFQWDKEEVFQTPSWVKEAIFYQIFPERFFNGNPQNDPSETKPWGQEDPTPENFFGGDLEGIEQKIPYLVDLGINAIWLNPIFASVSNHKYNIYDYMEIDPNFGDKKTFKRLVTKLHDQEIRVILDGVFNHTGTRFWAFQNILKHGSKSPYKDWYYIYEFPVQISPRPTYECWWDVAELPKLNVKNPKVKKYLLDMATYWTEEFEIDGWRLDVPNEIDHDFWIEFRKVIKKINPDCYIVGEIWDDGRPWLQGDQFDAVMNYLFRSRVLEFFASKKMEVADFNSQIGMLQLKYHQQVNFNLLNLLGSHDTARVLTLFKEKIPAIHKPVTLEEAKERLRTAIIFQMTYPGAPIIYYGDEIGMVGGPDPGCRRTMVWDEKDQDLELKNFYKYLIKLRKENYVFIAGDYIPLMTDDINRIYCYARKLGEKVALIALNISKKEKEITIPITELNLEKDQIFIDALTGERYPLKEGTILIPSVQGNYGAILLNN
jgi:cyclomaltodextrinase